MEKSPAFETKFLYRSLNFLLYGILLMPIWVWSIFLFPFITSKILYFRGLVEIVLVLYVILAIRHPELRPNFRNWLLRAVWIYFVVIFLASIFGVDFSVSLMGNVERGEGLLTILHFVVYFTILASVFKTREDWKKYLLFASSVIGYIALYSLFQLKCADIPQAPPGQGTCGLFLPTPGTRIAGTVGNPSFFAAFVMFGLFLSYYLRSFVLEAKFNFSYGKIFLTTGFIAFLQALDAVYRQEPFGSAFVIFFLLSAAVFLLNFKFSRYAWIGNAVLYLFVLYSSQTRGAILALSIALLLYAVFNLFRSKSRKIKIASAIFLILLLSFAVFIYTSRDSLWVQKSRTLYRLATISPKDITTQSRLDTWRASWQGFLDRPVLGYGYENYNIAFNKYFPARIFKDAGSQIWFDRSHNTILDVLVTSGALGLLSYLGIFLAALAGLWKIYRAGTREAAVILALLLLAYFVQNLFVFDTHATYLLIFLVLAHIAFLTPTPSPSPPQAGGEKRGREEKRGYPVGFVLPAVLSALMFFTLYFVNLEPAFANYYTTVGIRLGKVKDYRQIKRAFTRALGYGTYMDVEIRQRLADYVLEAFTSDKLSQVEKQELFETVVSEFEKSIKQSPRDVKNHLYLMTVLNRRSQKRNLDRISELGEQALKLSPTRPQIYFELGQAAFSQKDHDRGLAYFQKGLELNPEPKESHINFLIAAIIAKRGEIVEEEIKKIYELGYGLARQDFLSLARAYLETGDNVKVAENYEKALTFSPNDAELHARTAAAYKQICNLEKAAEHLNRAVELDQSFALEAREFLSQLERDCK